MKPDGASESLQSHQAARKKKSWVPSRGFRLVIVSVAVGLLGIALIFTASSYSKWQQEKTKYEKVSRPSLNIDTSRFSEFGKQLIRDVDFVDKSTWWEIQTLENQFYQYLWFVAAPCVAVAVVLFIVVCKFPTLPATFNAINPLQKEPVAPKEDSQEHLAGQGEELDNVSMQKYIYAVPGSFAKGPFTIAELKSMLGLSITYRTMIAEDGTDDWKELWQVLQIAPDKVPNVTIPTVDAEWDHRTERWRKLKPPKGTIPTGAVGLLLVVVAWVLRLIHLVTLQSSPGGARNIEMVFNPTLMILVGTSYILLLVGGVVSLIGAVSNKGRQASVIGMILVGLFLVSFFPWRWLIQ